MKWKFTGYQLHFHLDNKTASLLRLAPMVYHSVANNAVVCPQVPRCELSWRRSLLSIWSLTSTIVRPVLACSWRLPGWGVEYLMKTTSRTQHPILTWSDGDWSEWPPFTLGWSGTQVTHGQSCSRIFFNRLRALLPTSSINFDHSTEHTRQETKGFIKYHNASHNWQER